MTHSANNQRTRMLIPVLASIACAVLAVAVAGCGRSSRAPASAPSASTPNASQPTSTPAPSAVAPAPAPTRQTAIIGHDDGKPAGVLVPVADRSQAGANPAWDQAAYDRDPAAYCAQVVGDRAWQIAQPGADVPFLEPVGPTSLVARTGDIIRLSAKTKPGAPVSWTSNGLGEFKRTGLPSISAPSDQDGIASADFRLTQGTVGNVLITAGSPVCGSTLNYLIRITDDASAVKGTP